MVTWGEFARQRPDLATAGMELLHQFGVGLAFLATVRRDGGPRVHPICVIVLQQALYGLIIPSPKLDDLRRDGRYSLHSHPSPANEDALYVTGRASIHLEPALRHTAIEAFLNEPGRQGRPLNEAHFASQT